MAICPKCKQPRGCPCNFKRISDFQEPVCAVCEFKAKQEAHISALEAKKKAEENKTN